MRCFSNKTSRRTPRRLYTSLCNLENWAEIGQKSRKKSTRAKRFQQTKRRKTAYFIAFRRFSYYPDRTFRNAWNDVNKNQKTRVLPRFMGRAPGKIGLKLGWNWAEKIP